ncbi:MAG: alpha-glucan family phosphorylase [Chloroflexi bacterium]|nr:alpha-glucan family phosphorylase [Chloroflexota bacterium]
MLPERIGRLYELANNLWWSWHEEARQVFRSLDYALWRTSGHNPVKQLRQMSLEKLHAAAADPAFLEIYDDVFQKFDLEMRGEKTWFQQAYPKRTDEIVAYFSAEFAIHSSLPIYAGGLGVLAGDMCKEASDLGVPFVAVGFMYPQGYFRQKISVEGWQQEAYTELDFAEAPITPCPWPEGCGQMVPVRLEDRDVLVSAWQVKVGRVSLYLLDTNVKENSPADRLLSARLYAADAEKRIQQVITLGTAGVRVLRMLKLNPSAWHANEDLTAFMMLERLGEELRAGLGWDAAIERVRATSIFTTHTPVPAGHNVFSVQLVDRYFRYFWESLKIDRRVFLGLGQHEGLDPAYFSLTALALRLSGQANGVSRLHGRVARKMWHMLWPDKKLEDVPIGHVTNGVHLPTWQAPEVVSLCKKYLGSDLVEKQDDGDFWRCVVDIPDEDFWEIRQLLKTRLTRLIQDRTQHRWIENSIATQQVLAMGALLDPYALTIAFTRRFTEYKRPALILTNRERLKRMVNDPSRPVQIVFAGKSHPADFMSKRLLNQVYMVAMDRSFQGRIAFVEDYDMHISRELVRGVDLWLNNPRRLQEACGTSGMKASMNGVVNLSIRDGWWDEGYDGNNGWVIGDSQAGTSEQEDAADAEALYTLLEDKIIPLYYDRDRKGIPHGWIQMAKEAIRTITPAFSASRMVKEYAQQMYLPAILAGQKK